jgi:uncharacterized protein (TIGR00290 family)
MKKAYLNWSSGKDAALALYKIREEGKYSVEKLLTTVNSEIARVSMHGVRKELLISQAAQLGLPLEIVELDGNMPLSEYNKVMSQRTGNLKDEGFDYSIFGDIFLEDLKRYREDQLEKIGLKALFPLWKTDTRELMREFFDAGFKAIVVCVNSRYLDKSFCGRILDEEFLASLPAEVDPCGENGEFHTFVFDGPVFKEPVKFLMGEVVEKFFHSTDSDDDCFKDKKESWDTAFWYCDLIPE